MKFIANLDISFPKTERSLQDNCRLLQDDVCFSFNSVLDVSRFLYIFNFGLVGAIPNVKAFKFCNSSLAIDMLYNKGLYDKTFSADGREFSVFVEVTKLKDCEILLKEERFPIYFMDSLQRKKPVSIFNIIEEFGSAFRFGKHGLCVDCAVYLYLRENLFPYVKSFYKVRGVNPEGYEKKVSWRQFCLFMTKFENIVDYLLHLHSFSYTHPKKNVTWNGWFYRDKALYVQLLTRRKKLW